MDLKEVEQSIKGMGFTPIYISVGESFRDDHYFRIVVTAIDGYEWIVTRRSYLEAVFNLLKQVEEDMKKRIEKDLEGKPTCSS